MAFKEKFLKIVRENIESLYDAFVQMSRESLPKDADERYQYLKRTGYIARNDADVDVYVVRVASKHIPKFKWLYSNLFRTFPEVFSKDVDVVVWGCGCGLDLLALYDQAMTQKSPQLWLRVRHVTLVDISSAALNRAETIARVLFPTATVTAVICDLNQPEEIERRVSLRQLTAYVPRIHLISNLLSPKKE